MRYTNRLILFFLLITTVVSAQWRPQPYNLQYYGIKTDSMYITGRAGVGRTLPPLGRLHVTANGDTVGVLFDGTVVGNVSRGAVFNHYMRPGIGQDAIGVLVEDTIIVNAATGSGTPGIFAGMYVNKPHVLYEGVIPPGDTVVPTDFVTLFVRGPGNGPVSTSAMSLYVYEGWNRIRDALGVGEVSTFTDATLHARSKNTTWAIKADHADGDTSVRLLTLVEKDPHHTGDPAIYFRNYSKPLPYLMQESGTGRLTIGYMERGITHNMGILVRDTTTGAVRYLGRDLMADYLGLTLQGISDYGSTTTNRIRIGSTLPADDGANSLQVKAGAVFEHGDGRSVMIRNISTTPGDAAQIWGATHEGFPNTRGWIGFMKYVGTNEYGGTAVINTTNDNNTSSDKVYVLGNGNMLINRPVGSDSGEKLQVTGDAKVTGTLTVGGAKWATGTGSPESVVVAPVGSMYTRLDGGAGTTLYIKESGTGSTGWVAK